ncbi:PLP-dependent aminotransferase family protein [Nocardioides sp. HDW12B]|uniref:MocR-like transcription factor YczR n=1 Tax=Nocardioides sp. HDW12B TaxID=2714939 RepID=UPI00140E749C|nr:PLP-dependent aminotransferase family protein [Nocardioides sp. HDW12B]QIK67038.1 PLP-dependent aminotransferase family protein [Nocardioides sp. HDW12B]
MLATLSARRAAALLPPLGDHGPAYAALADGVRLLIADGRIPVGTRLPSERELTTALGVSRTTVTRAYGVLKDSGYLTARHGSGSVARLPHAASTSDALLGPQAGEGPAGAGDVVDLTCAAPVAPPGVTAAYEHAVAQLPCHLGDIGYYPSGLPELRRAIAERYAARGLPTDPEQVIVTGGALSALAIVLGALVSPGDRVLTESPSYPNALAALRRAGARLHGADIDQSGWATASLGDAVRQLRPSAAYLMPDWHNPTGLLMSDDQRAELAARLRAARTTAVVDETTAELAVDEPWTERMPLPFAAHLPGAVTVGSASKTFWGGLRIGWVRAPHDRVAELLHSRLTLDLGSPVVDQLALAHLMADHDAVVAARREQLAASRAALVAGLAAHLPSWRFRVPAGGLSLWCELPRPASSALVRSASTQGVRLAAGPLFAPEGGLERFVRLPFTRSPEQLGEATERLARAWQETPAGRRTTRPAAPALVT